MNRDKETQIAVVNNELYIITDDCSFGVQLMCPDGNRRWIDPLFIKQKNIITLPAPFPDYRWAEIGEDMRKFNNQTYCFLRTDDMQVHAGGALGPSGSINPDKSGSIFWFYQVPLVPLVLRYGDEGFEEWVKQFTEPDHPPPGYRLEKPENIPAKEGWIFYNHILRVWEVCSHQRKPFGECYAYAVPEDWPVTREWISVKEHGWPKEEEYPVFVWNPDTGGGGGAAVAFAAHKEITKPNPRTNTPNSHKLKHYTEQEDKGITHYMPATGMDRVPEPPEPEPRNDITPEQAWWLLKFFPWARFAAMDSDGEAYIYRISPDKTVNRWIVGLGRCEPIPGLNGYASDWQRSLINLKERACAV